jgi:hypothetical protein
MEGTSLQLTHAPIVVRDQDAALTCSVDGLGFETRADSRLPGTPRWRTVAPAGKAVELILILVRGRYTLEPHLPAAAERGGTHHVCLTAACRGAVAALTARGVPFTAPGPGDAP